MKNSPLACLIVLVACCTVGALKGATPKFESSIKAGFAERDITPAIGMEQPGNYGKSYHQTFHDACKVRVALFDDGKRKVVLIGVDALALPRSIVLHARAEITRRLNIPGDAVMIGASHSHSSGPTYMVIPGEYDTAPPEVQTLAYEESSNANLGYLVRVTEEIVRGVVAADSARVPAKLGFGFGHEDKVSFNRRLRMTNGQSWSHPGAMNPDIVDYAGPIDPEVGVLGAWDADGKLLGSVVNFACHATTSPGGISANWIYYLERTIQGSLDSRAPVVFLQGASGDVTQVDNRSPNARPAGEAWAALVGGRVGAEAVKMLLSVPRSGVAPLDAKQKVWRIQRRKPDVARITEAHAALAKGKTGPNLVEWTFAKETLMLKHLISIEPSVEVEVQALQIGPLVCVSNPAEYFVEYGLEIKKGSPFPYTFPVELANGCVGYVPTLEAFGPRGGGYETRLTSYSNLEISAGDQFAQTGIELAKAFTPGPIPEYPKLPAPGKPWAYGNLAPQLK